MGSVGTIGVLTSGGDAPGMNAAIKSCDKSRNISRIQGIWNS